MVHFQSEGNGENQENVCRCHDVPGGMSHGGPQGAKEVCGRGPFPQCHQLNGHEQVSPSRVDLIAWGTCSPSCSACLTHCTWLLYMGRDTMTWELPSVAQTLAARTGQCCTSHFHSKEHLLPPSFPTPGYPSSANHASPGSTRTEHHLNLRCPAQGTARSEGRE